MSGPLLEAQGLRFTNPTKYYYDYAADLGGRLIRDKLWFYGGIGQQSARPNGDRLRDRLVIVAAAS